MNLKTYAIYWPIARLARWGVFVLYCSLLGAGCQDPGSNKQLTAAEKKAMVTKTAPPQGMTEFMAKSSTKPTGDEKSPWDKPQKK